MWPPSLDLIRIPYLEVSTRLKQTHRVRSWRLVGLLSSWKNILCVFLVCMCDISPLWRISHDRESALKINFLSHSSMSGRHWLFFDNNPIKILCYCDNSSFSWAQCWRIQTGFVLTYLLSFFQAIAHTTFFSINSVYLRVHYYFFTYTFLAW